MNNKTLQSKTASCELSTLFIKNSGKKRLSKQTGVINQLLLIFIVCGLAYGAFIATNKGLISLDKAQSIVSELSKKVSGQQKHNDDFTGYGVQLVATQQLDQAKGIMNDFAKDGYSAFVLASETEGSVLYKVRLGPYAHKPEAVAVQDKVERRYPSNPYVKSSLVIYKPN